MREIAGLIEMPSSAISAGLMAKHEMGMWWEDTKGCYLTIATRAKPMGCIKK